jgi:hypothetical protein
MRETRGDATGGEANDRVVRSTVEDRKERVVSESFARDDVVWETSVVDKFRGDASICNTDNVGIVVHV